ncbi:MAG: hypothetical protein KBG83_05090 [Bacteroidetes bacterium]|nr:hypothetical protein [Bacteroidota bacterium]
MEQEPFYDEYEKPKKINSVLLGGLVIGLLSGLPVLSIVNCCCCAGVMAGGAVAVVLYKKELDRHQSFFFESSDALILGILSGIVGAVIGSVLSSLVLLIIGPVENEFLHSILVKLIANLESSGAVPPGAFDESLQQFEEAMSQGVTFGLFLRELVVSLIAYPIFSMVGSLLAYGIFNRKK